MIEETGTVVEKDGYYVWVEAGGRSACSSCGTSGSCGTSVLGGLFKPRSNRIRVFDPYNLQLGEQAVLGLNAGELVQAAFLAYLLPLLLMVATASMASNEGFGDAAVMTLSLFSLLTGIILMNFIGRHLSGGLAQVVVLGRVGDEDEHKLQFIKPLRNAP